MKPLGVAFRNEEFINGEIAKIEAQLKTANQADARLLRRIRDSYRDAHEPRFVLNERASIVTDAPFLVLDEVSMVDKELCADLLSFGKPILVFGDPGQLGPVKGDPSILSRGKADVLLTEVHRQARDNPIIRQSMRVREGLEIQPDGEAVTEISDAALVEYDLTDFDQILTYKNDTRRFFNKTLRVGHGLSLFPSGDDREKLICLENRRALGVYNGMAIQLEDVDVDADERNLFATVWREEKYCSEAEEPRGKSFIWKGEFENGEHHQESRKKDDEREGKIKGFRADWAYALTVHKAQGSEWRHVAFVDDSISLWCREKRKQVLYTAITRASDRFTLINWSH
jgi:exodeoxyribonuclease-5